MAKIVKNISWNFPESVQVKHKNGNCGNFHKPHYNINDENITFQIAHAQTYSFFQGQENVKLKIVL